MSLQLSLQDFIKVQFAITKAANMFKQQGEADHLAKRREALKNKDVQGYQKIMTEKQVEMRMKMTTATKLILNHLNIPEQTWPMTQQKYMSQPQTKKQVEMEIHGLMQEHTLSSFDMSKEPISKEDALKYVQILEEKKMQATSALIMQGQAGKMQQQQM